jgi:hypothetical protein
MAPRLLFALLLAAMLVGACIGDDVTTPSPTSPNATASAAISGTEPPTSDEPSEPPASEEQLPSAPPDETASPPPDEASPSPSAGPGPADACTGTDKNRDFYRAAASTLKWTVYCAVLPSGWFVDSGQYRQAGGGWVQISYRGPAGARFELHEGAFCAAEDGCVPPGSDAGDAPFGDQTGTLVALDDGGWAVVVDRGETISWLAVGTGMDEAALRKFAGALAVVGG